MTNHISGSLDSIALQGPYNTDYLNPRSFIARRRDRSGYALTQSQRVWMISLQQSVGDWLARNIRESHGFTARDVVTTRACLSDRDVIECGTQIGAIRGLRAANQTAARTAPCVDEVKRSQHERMRDQ